MSLKTKAAYNSQMPFTFHEKLNSNQFIITTEISPPKGVNPASTLMMQNSSGNICRYQ